CTLNEPNIVANFGHRWGLFPPGVRDPAQHRRANDVFVAAHRKAAAALKSGPGRAAGGLTLAMQDLQAVSGGETLRDAERQVTEDVFLDAARGDDFIGVQTYPRLRYGPDGMLGPEPRVPTTHKGSQ